MRNPFRKGTAVTNRTNQGIQIRIHHVDEAAVGRRGELEFIKFVERGETSFIGPEIYNTRRIAIRQGIEERVDRWIQLEPQAFEGNGELLIQWNSGTGRLVYEPRGGNSLERSMGAMILKRGVKVSFKILTRPGQFHNAAVFTEEP